MIRSNPPQLSVGICDTLWAGHPARLPPPLGVRAYAELLGNAGLGGKRTGQRCGPQDTCPRPRRGAGPPRGRLLPAFPWDLLTPRPRPLGSRALKAKASDTCSWHQLQTLQGLKEHHLFAPVDSRPLLRTPGSCSQPQKAPILLYLSPGLAALRDNQSP